MFLLISALVFLINGGCGRGNTTISSYFLVPLNGDTLEIKGVGPGGGKVSDRVVMRKFMDGVRYYRSDGTYYRQSEIGVLKLQEEEEGCSYFFLPETDGQVKLKRNDKEGVREIDELTCRWEDSKTYFVDIDDENYPAYSLGESRHLTLSEMKPETSCSYFLIANSKKRDNENFAPSDRILVRSEVDTLDEVSRVVKLILKEIEEGEYYLDATRYYSVNIDNNLSYNEDSIGENSHFIINDGMNSGYMVSTDHKGDFVRRDYRKRKMPK